MSPSLSAAAHVGRLGALAVASGVGAAIASGSAVAWADDSGGSGASAHDTSAPGANDGGSSASGKAGSSSNSRSQRASSRPSTATGGKSDSGTPSSSKSAKSAAAWGGASGSGGALTSDSVAQPTAAASGTPAQAATATVSPSRVSRSGSAVAIAPAAVATVPKIAEVVSAPVAVTPAPVARVVALPTATIALSAPSPVSRLLAAVGLAGTRVGGSPATPATTPALWALAAWARREFDPTRSTSQAASATTSQPVILAAAVVTSPTTLKSTPVGWVTGQANNAYPGAGWPQTNNTTSFNIWGTDLGVMWENGLTHNIQVAFGDTFSGPNQTGSWRSNVLLLSDNIDLTNGLRLLPTGPAYQFIPSAPSALFPILNSEVTIIPTSAVSVNNEQYVNYMSIKSWDAPGRWTTNYSAISMYNQATDKWVLVPSTIRSAGWFRSSTRYVAGSQNFQQVAYVLQPADQVPDGGTQYLYAFGTPSGRAGSAYLSRVPAGSVTDLSTYEYWDGSTWVTNKPAVAAPILGDSTHSTGLFGFIKDIANNPKFFGGYFAGLTGAKTGGNVSEMSAQYNDYLKKYVVLYANGNNDVVLRTADQPEGPWSDPVIIATSAQYPGLYAPMIHPWSGTGKLNTKADGSGTPDVSNLYWNMSIWSNYNVVLMQTDLTPLTTTVV